MSFRPITETEAHELMEQVTEFIKSKGQQGCKPDEIAAHLASKGVPREHADMIVLMMEDSQCDCDG